MRFETLRRLRYLACRGDWGLSFALWDGYYAMDLREDVRNYFTINVRGTLLGRFAALAMGRSLSPCYFLHHSRRDGALPPPAGLFATYARSFWPSLRRLCRRTARGVCLQPIVDDFLFKSPRLGK